MTQQELNATTCYCGHRHDQHSYNATTGKAACRYQYNTRDGVHTCPCEHCVHPEPASDEYDTVNFICGHAVSYAGKFEAEHKATMETQKCSACLAHADGYFISGYHIRRA